MYCDLWFIAYAKHDKMLRSVLLRPGSVGWHRATVAAGAAAGRRSAALQQWPRAAGADHTALPAGASGQRVQGARQLACSSVVLCYCSTQLRSGIQQSGANERLVGGSTLLTRLRMKSLSVSRSGWSLHARHVGTAGWAAQHCPCCSFARTCRSVSWAHSTPESVCIRSSTAVLVPRTLNFRVQNALQMSIVSMLQDRDDLVAAALASAHLPFILDWRLAAAWRGKRCVDGSLMYILTRCGAPAFCAAC